MDGAVDPWALPLVFGTCLQPADDRPGSVSGEPLVA